MRRARVAQTSVAATLLLLVAACGGGSGGGSGGGAEAAVCDGEIEGGKITMFAHEGAEADAYKAAIKEFNQTAGKDAGVTVDLTMIPEGQYTDQVNAAAASGDLPAVLDFDGPNMANLAWGGHLVPIEDCVPKGLKDKVLPSLIQQGTYDDQLYGLGSFDSGLGLFAYKSALKEVGARIPTGPEDAWTADEFEKILRDLKKAGYEHPLDPKFWYGSQGEWFSYAYDPIVWSSGGHLIDEQHKSADGELNDPAVVESFEQFQTWVQDGLVDKDAEDDSNFLEKRSPISWVGHWMYKDYKKAAGDDLVVLPLPDFGEGSKTSLGSWAWGITSAAEDPDAAWAVIEFLMSDETIGQITEVNGAPPGTTTALEKSELYSEGGDLHLFTRQLQASPEVAVPRPVTPAYPNITQEMRSVVDDIVQGADVQKTLDEAVKAIDADIEKNEGYPPPSEQ
jgi:multiple sugar transport system substrate-binding protein